MTKQDLNEMLKDSYFDLGFQTGRLMATVGERLIKITSEDKLKLKNKYLELQLKMVKDGKIQPSQINLDF